MGINALREELHVYAKNAGAMVGEITLIDSGDTIDCTRMGSGGYSIPSIVEPEVIQFRKHNAKFILHVEKDTVWRRFNEDKFWRKHKCILTHGGGQPPRGVRRLLHRMHHELKLPDLLPAWTTIPGGITSTASSSRARSTWPTSRKRMAIPDARFLGLRAIDFQRCGLSNSVKINLNDTDRKRAKQIAGYPWFENKKAWQKEIKQTAGQRLQAGSRSPDQQGHQLRDRGLHAATVGREGLLGLSVVPLSLRERVGVRGRRA